MKEKMMKRMAALVITVGFFLAIAPTALARDAARDLRKMVGYTIIMADTIDKVFENDGNKFIKLSGGQVFKVDFLLLDPLVLTDVIVFAKAPPKELVQKYAGKLPEQLLYSYKLLIDNEAYDATPQ
jgi:hypothetical protein